jgi:hypothetical protein
LPVGTAGAFTLLRGGAHAPAALFRALPAGMSEGVLCLKRRTYCK